MGYKKLRCLPKGWVVNPRRRGSPEPTWHEAHSASCQVGSGDPLVLGYTTQPSANILIFKTIRSVFFQNCEDTYDITASAQKGENSKVLYHHAKYSWKWKPWGTLLIIAWMAGSLSCALPSEYIYGSVCETKAEWIYEFSWESILALVSSYDADRGPASNHEAYFVVSVNPLRTIVFQREHNIYLHFVSFLHIGMTQVVKILSQVRQGPTYPT